MKYGTYKIWVNRQEQWDPNDIDEPDAVIEARSPQAAAREFAIDGGDSAAEVIVRDEAGVYYEVLVEQSWETRTCRPTTLEELCAP